MHPPTGPSAFRCWRKQLVKSTVNGTRCFLALSGALLARGVLPEQLPALVRAISKATANDTRTEDRVTCAESTVEATLMNRPHTGYRNLRERWPAVAAALDAVTAKGHAAVVHALAQAKPENDALMAKEEAATEVERAIVKAPAGVSFIATDCGLGKTHAGIRVAIQRASKVHASEAISDRAPADSKTAISVDKHSLAMQVAEDIKAQGVAVLRLFGPLSLRDEDDKPVCMYFKEAEPLVAAGQPLDWLFCKGQGRQECPLFETCPAREGQEGDPDARIVVGPHALLNRLTSRVGQNLVLVDEPPVVIDVQSFAADDLEETENHLSEFVRETVDLVKDGLAEVRAWFDRAKPGEMLRLHDLVRSGEGQSPLFVDPDTPPTPQLTVLAGTRARKQASFAAALATPSRILGMILRALTLRGNPAFCVERVKGEKRLVVRDLHRAWDVISNPERTGATILLDANAALHRPLVTKLLGYEPPITAISAPDGAPIARTLRYRKGATRKGWFAKGQLQLNPHPMSCVAEMIAWLKSDPPPTKSGIISMRPIAVALEAARAPQNDNLPAQWVALGQAPETLTAAQNALGPLMEQIPGDVVFGYYGGLRGLNHMKDVDKLVTLGDAYPNLEDVKAELLVLRMDAANLWEARLSGLCRAELEQAHGRLRTIHRTKPGYALHIGRELPSGHAWGDGSVTVVGDRGGRGRSSVPTAMKELEDAVARAGGLRHLADALGISHSTLSKCRARGRVTVLVSRQLREWLKVG